MLILRLHGFPAVACGRCDCLGSLGLLVGVAIAWVLLYCLFGFAAAWVPLPCLWILRLLGFPWIAYGFCDCLGSLGLLVGVAIAWAPLERLWILIFCDCLVSLTLLVDFASA